MQFMSVRNGSLVIMGRRDIKTLKGKNITFAPWVGEIGRIYRLSTKSVVNGCCALGKTYFFPHAVTSNLYDDPFPFDWRHVVVDIAGLASS